MTPSSQKADVRPISFVLHDMTAQAQKALTQICLVIRPEDLSITYPSRVAVHQTLGGAWVDSFGKGIPTINISGHTGWRGGLNSDGEEADGLALFSELHTSVFEKWHKARADALAKGLDPDLVKLIFSDALDNVTWVVTPNQFVLKRNKARPLLAQYQIAMTYVSDDVKSTLDALKAISDSKLRAAGLSSLANAIKTIQNFAAKIKGAIASVLGPISAAVKSFVALTAGALSAVNSVVGAVRGVVGYAASALISIAKDLTKAGTNIMASVAAIKNLPAQIKGMFMEVKAAFNNAFCVLKNAFKGGPKYPTYDSLYGASTCSSTSGGRPISPYIDKNPFAAMYPAEKPLAAATNASAAEMKRVGNIDVVTEPMTRDEIKYSLNAITPGVQINV